MDMTHRLPDSPEWWKVPATGDHRDYAFLKYDIGQEPLLREIRATDGARIGYVTRNSFGAEVLNTDRLLIIDVDQQDDNERCTSRELYRAMCAAPRDFDLEAALLERLQPASIETCFRWAGGARAALRLEAPLAWHVYATRNGFRLVEIANTWTLDPCPLALLTLMEFLFADEAYVRICLDQQLFRARLTPKPWREHYPGEGRACVLVAQHSSGLLRIDSDSDLRPLVEEHDRRSGALEYGATARPLA